MSAPPVVCPNCSRRRTMRVHSSVYSEAAQQGDIVSWQCVYCGAVSEMSGPGRYSVTYIDRIVLQPGELAEMRDARRAP